MTTPTGNPISETAASARRRTVDTSIGIFIVQIGILQRNSSPS